MAIVFSFLHQQGLVHHKKKRDTAVNNSIALCLCFLIDRWKKLIVAFQLNQLIVQTHQ